MIGRFARLCLLISSILAPALAQPAESDPKAFHHEFRRLFDDLRGVDCGQYIAAGVGVAESPLFANTLSKSAQFGFLHALSDCASQFGETEAQFRAAQVWVLSAPNEHWPRAAQLQYGASSGHPEASLDAFDWYLAKRPGSIRNFDWTLQHKLINAADRVDASGDRALALYEMFARLARATRASDHDDFLRLAHARLLLSRGRADEARKLLSTVTETQAIAVMRIDRLFDALREDPDFEARLELKAAAERDLVHARETMEAQPRLMAPVERYVSKLIMLGRLEEAITLADSSLAQQAANPRTYTDGKETRRWLLTRRAQVLNRLGRSAEATDTLLEAANLREYRRPNVSNMINLTGHLMNQGRAGDALRLLHRVGDPTRYGQSWVEAIRSCAAAQMNDEDQRASSLDFLKAHEAENEAALSQALLCSNDLDGAAELMIRRLGRRRTSAAALLALQGRPATLADDLVYRRLLRERFELLRARGDVRAAAESVGRIGDLPYDVGGDY